MLSSDHNPMDDGAERLAFSAVFGLVSPRSKQGRPTEETTDSYGAEGNHRVHRRH